MKITRLALLFLTVSFVPLTASAQMNENAQSAARMERLERDIQLLQRQLSQGGGGQTISVGGDAPNEAQLEVRLSAIEESVRSLRGRVEESEFQTRKVAEQLEKLQRDVEYRFSQAGGQLPAATTVVTPTPRPAAPAPAEAAPLPPDTSGRTTAGDGVLRLPEATPPDGSFATPREHYNYAFRLLNQTQYEAAAAAFAAFTQQYPKDPLVGNAYYWEGETFYIRRDYVKAADNFRKGFEALPEGPKAADNLLKLAMSLDALNRDKEACVVLSQIVTKFKKSSTSVTDKATQEQKRIGCK